MFANKAIPRPGCIPARKDPHRHAEFIARRDWLITHGGTQAVFIGDSITDGWRERPQSGIFERAFGRLQPYNIGISGDETQHVLWRIENGELDGITPKLAVVMIGTNNLGNSRQTPAQTIDGIRCVLSAVHEKLPGSKILLLGIFPRGKRPADPFRAQIREVNEAIATFHGTSNVTYLDIGTKFLAADGTLPESVMPDGLHPNLRGYEIWEEAIRDVVDELMR